MTLRRRIFLTLAVPITLLIALGAVWHYQTVRDYFVEQLDEKAKGILRAVQSEVRETDLAINEAVDDLLGEGSSVPWDFLSGTISERYRWANKELEGSPLDILKVLDLNGVVRSSGYWPASYGAVDPKFDTYRQHFDSTILISEITARGQSFALERPVKAAARNGESLVFVLGRFYGLDFLERMRRGLDGDLLALCRNDGGVRNCEISRAEDFSNVSSRDLGVAENIGLEWVSAGLLGKGDLRNRLWVGLGRSRLDSLNHQLFGQTFSIALVGLLLSLWLAFILADRLGKPISKLAGATQSLREGSLETRVEVPENSASEIRNLVDSFNHMAEDLRHSREKLVQAERVATWREIARGLAHELKNPLTPILGALQVVERAHQKGREDFDEILSEQAEAVKEEVHRLKNMADNFSRFAKLPEPKPEQLNLMDVLDKALTLYGESNPGVLIKRAFEPEAITMLADRDRLGTVFSNLVKNGVEAMEGEGVLGVSAGIEGEACWVRIQDSGPGVAETVRDRLFTPYITTKAQGTGLGLALVHRIVTEMNGEIQLVDCEGVGACFEITLPRSPV